jgi:Spy/CpxP family protein refolding chaperone
MNRFRWMTAVALVAVLSAGSAALAQGPRGGGPGRAGGPAGRGLMGALPLASLNLTQAQQDLIRDIRERNGGEMSQIDAKLRQAHDAQQKAVSAIPLNEGAIRAATLAVAEVQADAAILQARVQNEIFASLTSEQQEQVKKALADREQRLQQRQADGQRRRERRQ